MTLRVIDPMRLAITTWAIGAATCLLVAACGDGKEDPVAGRIIQNCLFCPEAVIIPAGTLDLEEEGQSRTVGIRKPLAVGRYEVTVGQFRQFVQSSGHRPVRDCKGLFGGEVIEWPGTNWQNPGHYQTPEFPVVCISRDDAEAYTVWLSETTGHPYRLLSAEEWEYAARAGRTGQLIDNDRICWLGNFYDEETKGHRPSDIKPLDCSDRKGVVAAPGSYQGNDFRLSDMVGNVSEWVATCGQPVDDDGNCSAPVHIGSSYIDGIETVAFAKRQQRQQEDAFAFVGFRVVRDL